MITERTVYSPDQAHGPNLHDRLSAVHQLILGSEPLEGPVRHTAHFGLWDITMDTSETGELRAASVVRLGQEEYRFARVETSAAWESQGPRVHFEDAHFSNLVSMAVREGLDWSKK